MQNKKFLFTSMVLAIIANIAIIGCNRQGSGSAQAEGVNSISAMPASESGVPAAKADSGVQKQNVVVQKNKVEMKNQTPRPEEQTMGQPPSEVKDAKQPNTNANSKIEIKTFPVSAPGTGYGYDIIIDGKPYIHQYNIPGMPGNNGFSSEQYAHKAAELAVYKIRHNIMPPALDKKELDSLGVLK